MIRKSLARPCMAARRSAIRPAQTTRRSVLSVSVQVWIRTWSGDSEMPVTVVPSRISPPIKRICFAISRQMSTKSTMPESRIRMASLPVISGSSSRRRTGLITSGESPFSRQRSNNTFMRSRSSVLVATSSFPIRRQGIPCCLQNS